MQIPERLRALKDVREFRRVGTGCRWIASGLSSIVTGLLVTGALIGVPYLTLSPLIEDFSLQALNPPSQRTLVLYDDAGQKFAQRGGCVAEPVKFSEVPPHLVDALLSMEDRRFYSHLGIDPIGLARAIIANREAGHIVQGGSTITQQLIKNSYLSSERTFARKEKEAWMALSLELRLSKNEILERYLSSAYFGEGCYGLRAAAKRYFQTPVKDLTIPQSAYLVALLKSPTTFREKPEKAKERAALVMSAMVENGKLDPKERVKLKPVLPKLESSPSDGEYYADWVARTIRVPKDGNFAPLPVHTSYDAALQKLADEAVDKIMSKQGKARKAGQAAMVVMRPDGEVLAMVGGRNYDKSQFNRAVMAKRQPGSSFKLFVYLAGLRGGLTPDSQLVDQPIKVGDYEPENFGHRFRGPVTMRRGFASSINTIAVQISEAVGRQPVIDAARQLGIKDELQATPSIALGVYEVDLLEMTSAYAAIAAGAYPVKPWAITGFTKKPDHVLPPKGAGEWRLEHQRGMLDLMRANVTSGSGRGSRISVPSYGKTGTSQNYRDAWFIGFAGNLVVGVWVGNDDNSSMSGVTGGSLPAMIWSTFMRDAIKEDPDFHRNLSQVAAFPARYNPGADQVALASDVLEGRYAEDDRRGDFFGFFKNRRERRERRERRGGGGIFGGFFR